MCNCQTVSGKITVETDKRHFIVINHNDGETNEFRGIDEVNEHIMVISECRDTYELERLQDRLEVYEIVRRVDLTLEQSVKVTLI